MNKSALVTGEYKETEIYYYFITPSTHTVIREWTMEEYAALSPYERFGKYSVLKIVRLPEGFLDKENKVCILTGAIELMKKRISTNYKLAIPQYYENKIQLLLPLCLDTDNGIPNLALAVTKLDTCYQVHTCLTLDMAYNNARLIAKPESNWLSL